VDTETCSLCDRPAAPILGLGALPAQTCPACARALGGLLLERPALLTAIWPALAEPDDGTPEPRVRLADGRSVEVRERTAEMKRDLPVEKRAELAELLDGLGLLREALLEAGFVLQRDASAELAQRALDVLFAEGRATGAAVAVLRRHLLPS
jgi:hypothetical protein